jgi:hypothetical protein
LSDKTDKMWFAPKRFGFGAGFPISWEGWAVLAAYVAGVALISTYALNDLQGVKQIYLLVAGVGMLSALLIIITHAKTRGGWRWRWGDDD